MDCGSQQTFTCNVTGIAALWTISGLSGISIIRDNGLGVANHSRITTTDTDGATPSSTITITGFTTADNGGTIQCINLDDNNVQGMASISVGESLACRLGRLKKWLSISCTNILTHCEIYLTHSYP